MAAAAAAAVISEVCHYAQEPDLDQAIAFLRAGLRTLDTAWSTRHLVDQGLL